MLRLGDRDIPLTVSRHPHARHISVRLDRLEGKVRLVLPRRAALREGLEFVRHKTDWLLDQLETLPARVPFADGAAIPVLGVEHVVRHRPGTRRGVWHEAGEILVSGNAEHVARRVADYLKATARAELAARTRAKATMIERTVRRVGVREMRTRWGSCSSQGHVSYCWRLILAPERVLDYIVAHEVAHLRELNHGHRFWALTARLTGNVAEARAWLRAHGDDLLRYG